MQPAVILLLGSADQDAGPKRSACWLLPAFWVAFSFLLGFYIATRIGAGGVWLFVLALGRVYTSAADRAARIYPIRRIQRSVNRLSSPYMQAPSSRGTDQIAVRGIEPLIRQDCLHPAKEVHGHEMAPRENRPGARVVLYFAVSVTKFGEAGDPRTEESPSQIQCILYLGRSKCEQGFYIPTAT